MKEFVFNGMLLKDDLGALASVGISVDVATEASIVARAEAMQFPLSIMTSAAKMASVFVVFFCMENSAREVITQRLSERFGLNWWDAKVPTKIQTKINELLRNEEIHRYHTARSSEKIGYTTFGNLEQIIIANWQDFEDLFPDQAWVKSRFADMERSRNIIMHTGVLGQFEIERLEVIARDWTRQVG